MSRLAVVCLVLASACINIKPYGTPVDGNGPPGDGGGGTDGSSGPPFGIVGEVHAVMDVDNGITVTGPGYIVHFPGTGTGFPDDIDIVGVHVLKTSTTCTDPSGTGVQIVPAVRSDAASATQSNIAIGIAGPVIARVIVTWMPALGGTCGTATVVSAWTFFPDGRISRFDQVAASGSGPASCACDGGAETDYTVRVESLYDHNAISSLEGPDNGLVAPQPTGNFTPGDLFCMNNAGYHLLAYDAPGPGPVLYSVGSDLGVVYDLAYQVAPLDGPYYGLSGLIVVAGATGSCQPYLDRANAYQVYVSISFDAGANGDNTNYDGIAGGFTTTPGQFGFTLSSNQVTFEPRPEPTQPAGDYVPAPPGYAIGLVFPSPATSYVATNKAGRTLTTDEVKFQPFGTQNRVIVWLRDGIAFGDSVTVTAP